MHVNSSGRWWWKAACGPDSDWRETSSVHLVLSDVGKHLLLICVAVRQSKNELCKPSQIVKLATRHSSNQELLLDVGLMPQDISAINRLLTSISWSNSNSGLCSSLERDLDSDDGNVRSAGGTSVKSREIDRRHHYKNRSPIFSYERSTNCGIRVNSTRGQLDTCVELTRVSSWLKSTRHAVNSTLDQSQKRHVFKLSIIINRHFKMPN